MIDKNVAVAITSVKKRKEPFKPSEYLEKWDEVVGVVFKMDPMTFRGDGIFLPEADTAYLVYAGFGVLLIRFEKFDLDFIVVSEVSVSTVGSFSYETRSPAVGSKVKFYPPWSEIIVL